MEQDKLNEKIAEEEQWLRSVVIPDMVKNKKLSNDDETEISVDQILIKFIGIEEAFMLTSCYRATIDYHFENNNKTNKICLVVKKTPKMPREMYDAVNFGALFNSEILTYTAIMPTIEKFIKHPFKVPNYFYSHIEEGFATIVLEDFNVDDWRVAKDKFNLSLDHILTAVSYLGDFHGIGFAMRELQPADFLNITCNLREPRYDTELNPDWLTTMKVALKRLLKVTQELEPSVSVEFLEKLKNLLEVEPMYGKQRVAPREPYITLVHGDFLRNNIAFQYAKDGDKEKAIKTMMFDLQTMRVSSPMVDLTVLLLLSSFADVRHNNFEKIFKSYCDAVIKSYETYAGKNAPKHLSYESLLREYILFMPYGIEIASFFLVMLIEPEDMTSEEMFAVQRTPEEIEADTMTRGGEVVNKEISHQVKELFDLSQKYNIDISEGIKF